MDLEVLHRKSTANKDALAVSGLAGCFSCVRTFPPSTIRDWVRSGPRRDRGDAPRDASPMVSRLSGVKALMDLSRHR